MAEKSIAVEDALRVIVRIAFCIALAALPLAGVARAETYPDRPVRVIVGFAPGGPTDVIARIVSDKLTASLGKQFYVVNQPGAVCRQRAWPPRRRQTVTHC